MRTDLMIGGNVTNSGPYPDEMFEEAERREKRNRLTAVIYSDGSQECERMSMLLKSLGGEFHEYLLGIDFSDKQFRMEFGSEATYPQVSLGSEHIGSMKEALHYMSEQGLFT